MLGKLKKNESDIANIVKKTHNFKKTKIILKKKQKQMTLKSYFQILQRKGKKKDLLGRWMFSAKI